MKDTFWGEHSLAPGETGVWRIGPLTLGLRRLEREWQVYHEQSDEWREDDGERECVLDPAQAELRARFVMEQTADSCRLQPHMADRPVVSQPAIPFHVLPGQRLILFVSTPLWASVQDGGQVGELMQLPVLRPSDTWFGPSTREGELCYAVSTSARIDPAALPGRTYRATTPVLVVNQSASALYLEKLKLPVPLLALYQDAEGKHWTQGVSMTRRGESGQDLLEIMEGPPSQCATPSLVTPARQKPDRKSLGGALGMLFG